MKEISILGLSKSDVLWALYKRATPTSNSSLSFKTQVNLQEGLKRAQEVIRAKYPGFSDQTNIRMEFDVVDLGEGQRKLSVILDNDECYSDAYDQLYGANAALEAITNIPSPDSILANSRKRINIIRTAIRKRNDNNNIVAAQTAQRIESSGQDPASTNNNQLTQRSSEQPRATTQQIQAMAHQPAVGLNIPFYLPPFARPFLPSGAHTANYQRGYFIGQQQYLASVAFNAMCIPFGSFKKRQ